MGDQSLDDLMECEPEPEATMLRKGSMDRTNQPRWLVNVGFVMAPVRRA